MKRLLIITALTMSVACSGQSQQQHQEPISTQDGTGQPQTGEPSTFKDALSQMESEGTYPKLNRDESLLGTDENDNGIRDDIDEFINNLDAPTETKQASKQKARSMQNALRTDLSDPQDVRAVSIDSMRATKCLLTTAQPPEAGLSLIKQLEAYTYNTSPRMDYYLAYAKALSGSVILSPNEGYCDE